jgi:hypothetical protein
MLADAPALRDDTKKWLPEFKKEIHILIFVTGDSTATVEEKLAQVKKIIGSTVTEIKRVDGKVRDIGGKQEGHEQFVTTIH